MIMSSLPKELETPATAREKLLNSLADELEQLCSKTRKVSATNRRKPSGPLGLETQLSSCSCTDDLSFRITGRREKCAQHQAETAAGLQLQLLSPSGFGQELLGPEYIESPISPSIAVGSSIQHFGSSARQSIEDHQICFGMDLSTEAIYARKLFGDPNGNKQVAASNEDSSGVSSCTGSEHLYPTHRVTHPFVPRHVDEVILETGDPVYVERDCEDHWCHGTNLRSGQRGIFPSAHVYEVDIEEEIFPTSANLALEQDERDTFYLTFLGAIEVAHHKGNDILVQAINKVLNLYQNKEEFVVPKPVLMDISFRGIHLIDKTKRNLFRAPKYDYFYSLQNISFCGAHPKQLRYFGFVTKHPLLPKFACHVFLSNSSTQPVVEAIGRAFKKSYDEYMAFAHPTEDIYLE